MAPTEEPPIVVIGSGPCGLGAAHRLHEIGVKNFIVLEAGSEPGGLSVTATDEEGFLWDMGKFLLPLLRSFKCLLFISYQ